MEPLMRRAQLVTAACVAAATLTCGEPPGPAPFIGPVTDVSAATGVGAAPMVALSAHGDRAIAWVSAADSGADGRLYVSVNGAAPVAIADPLAAVEVHGEAPPKLAFAPDGSLYAVYLLGKDVGKRFPVSALRVVRSRDNGRTWSAPVTVTDDTVAFGSHNFHALTTAPNGGLYVSWLDGRTGKSAAYMTYSADGGSTWAANVRMSVGEACPCCRTSLAAGADGTVYAAWRTVLAGNIRDVVVARSRDHGATWSRPVRVHADDWEIDACPHAGPSLQLDDAGRLHVLWWTGKPGAAGVYYATSADSAATFSEPVTISRQTVPVPSHVQLALGDGGAVVAAWDELKGGASLVYTRTSLRDRGFGPVLALTDTTHTSQFPVVGTHRDTAYVAWASTSAAPPDHGKMDMKEMKVTLEPVGATRVLMRPVSLHNK
jgi:hypothetical protein